MLRSEAPWQIMRTSISPMARNAWLAISGRRRTCSPTRQTSALWFSQRTLAIPFSSSAIAGKPETELTSSARLPREADSRSRLC